MESEDEMHVRHPAFLKFYRITIRDHSPIELSVDYVSEELLLLLLENVVRQERIVLPRLARQQVLLKMIFFHSFCSPLQTWISFHWGLPVKVMKRSGVPVWNKNFEKKQIEL